MLFSSDSLAWLGESYTPFIVPHLFVALPWTHFITSVSLLNWRAQNWTQYSRWGLNNTEYRGRIISLVWLATLFLIHIKRFLLKDWRLYFWFLYSDLTVKCLPNIIWFRKSHVVTVHIVFLPRKITIWKKIKNVIYWLPPSFTWFSWFISSVLWTQVNIHTIEGSTISEISWPFQLYKTMEEKAIELCLFPSGFPCLWW